LLFDLIGYNPWLHARTLDLEKR